MSRLSCISSPPKLSEPTTDQLNRSSSTYSSDSKTNVLRARSHSRMQTTIEVVKTEFGRTRRGASLGKPKSSENGWTPIQYAAFKGREAAVIHFLRSGQCPDTGSQNGKSPLCIATVAGHTSIVRMLLEAGADVNTIPNPGGETAMHIAIKNGRTDIMDLLLQYNPDLEVKTTSTGETPLHYAAKSGSLSTVVSLLRKGADYTALDNSNRSPAEVAFEARHIHVAVAIITEARGKRKLLKEKEMLLRHVEQNQNRFSLNNELIADIFEAGCDPDSTVLVEAIQKDDIKLAEMFLERGADPNRATAKGLLPIRLAMKSSNADMLRLLVKYNVNVTIKDREGYNLLQRLLSIPRAQEKEVVTAMFECLLSAGADSEVRYSDGKTLLHHAVKPEFQLTKVAKLLLEVGLKVKAQDNSGCTPLHAAIRSKPCIDLLLKHGADPKLMNYDNLTPLLYALTTSTAENEPDLDTLIRVSNLETMAPNAKMPLHLAAENGLARAVRTLLRHRINTTIRDSEGSTPLFLAVRNGHWSIVSVLAAMPGVTAWDQAGNTALHLVAASTPIAPSTWEDIAGAVAKFCEKGVCRTMRDKLGATPLIVAVKTLDEEGLPVVEALLKKNAAGPSNCVSHEDHKQRSALYFAATLGKLGFVTALLRHGATINLQDWATNGLLKPDDPIHEKILKTIAEHEWIRRARTLQRNSLSPNSLLPQILPEEDLVFLLTMGLDPNVLPNVAGPSLLWVVLKQLRLPNSPPYEYIQPMVQAILEKGGDPNVLCAVGPPPIPPMHPLTFILLHAPKMDIDLIELMLSKGAKLSTLTTQPTTSPLHAAVAANRMDLVDEFLTRGATVNAVDQKGRTPLFLAAEKGYWEILDLLLGSGADANIKCLRGDTCLHLGVAAGSYEVVKSLLKKGAKVAVENKKGKKPIDLVPETMEEKEKERLTMVVQDTERKQRRDEDAFRRQKELEEEMEKARIKRKEEERIGKEKREKERAIREQQEREKKEQEQKERERATAALTARSDSHQNLAHLPQSSEFPALTTKSQQKQERARHSRMPFRSFSAQSLRTPPESKQAAPPEPVPSHRERLMAPPDLTSSHQQKPIPQPSVVAVSASVPAPLRAPSPSPPKNLNRVFSLPFLHRSKPKSKDTRSPIVVAAPPILSLNFQSPSAATSTQKVSLAPKSSTPQASFSTNNASLLEPKAVPRIDSAIYASMSTTPPPVSGEKKVEKRVSDADMKSELEGWLKISGMLDRL